MRGFLKRLSVSVFHKGQVPECEFADVVLDNKSWRRTASCSQDTIMFWKCMEISTPKKALKSSGPALSGPPVLGFMTNRPAPKWGPQLFGAGVGEHLRPRLPMERKAVGIHTSTASFHVTVVTLCALDILQCKPIILTINCCQARRATIFAGFVCNHVTPFRHVRWYHLDLYITSMGFRPHRHRPSMSTGLRLDASRAP